LLIGVQAGGGASAALNSGAAKVAWDGSGADDEPTGGWQEQEQQHLGAIWKLPASRVPQHQTFIHTS
jgi:hypothetical protein